MKIIQYTIDCIKQKDIYEDSNNMVIYTGNHDNNTIVGWYNSLSQEQKEGLVEFLRKNNCLEEEINLSMIKYCLESVADYAIFPVQDIMGLDENSRINLPGHEFDNNWSWELINFNDFRKGMEKFRKIIEKH